MFNLIHLVKSMFPFNESYHLKLLTKGQQLNAIKLILITPVQIDSDTGIYTKAYTSSYSLCYIVVLIVSLVKRLFKQNNVSYQCFKYICVWCATEECITPNTHNHP